MDQTKRGDATSVAVLQVSMRFTQLFDLTKNKPSILSER